MQYSYVVRIYRHEKDNRRMLVGTVEKVGKEGRSAFTNMDELWKIMNEGTDIERVTRNIDKGHGKKKERKS